MQLRDRDGITCDLCNAIYNTAFTYYSWDFRQVRVLDNRRLSLDHIFDLPVVLSLDVCLMCFEVFKPIIIKNYSSIMTGTNRTSVGIVCELSGKRLTNTFVYYHVAVTKVDVSGLGSAPQMTTDKRHLELNVCEEEFAKFKTKYEAKIAMSIQETGQWSTTSE